MTEQPSRRRAGGREARRAAREESTTSSTPYLTRTIPPYEVMSEEGLEIIENNAEVILEEVGIDFRDYPSSLELFKMLEQLSMENVFDFLKVCAGK